MFILPLDSPIALLLASICLAFEFLRIVIAFLIAKPSSEIGALNKQKAEATAELLTIKSVQLEFVKHSLLTRKIIKYDKRVETLQSEYAPRARRVKNAFRILRVIFYAGCAIYFAGSPVVMVNSQLIWPASWFTKRQLIYLQPWFVIFVSGLACRHLLRTVLPIFIRNTSFP